ncbi:hypothetical protein NXY80_11095, partial [Escherichia coli]|nr:hypothetical protein [Escherichia coli]
RLRFSGPKTSIICSPMTSLKTSIKTITYLSDIGCLEIQGASLFFPLSPNVDIYNLWRKTRIELIKTPYFNMLQMMLFLIHTRHKYHRHKPDKYPINMQQSFNY